MDDAIQFLSGLCLLAGSFFAVVSSLAMVRLPDYYSRVHGAGITDTMGAGLILLGLAFQAGLSLVTAKLFFVLVFIVITGPTASHALAKAAYQLGLEPVVDDGEPED